MSDYDVVVIGAGPAGYVAAIRAAQLGQKTAVVDKQWLGGVCLNVGCIPSKALLRNADVAHTLRERGKEFGFTMENLKLDFTVAVKRSRQVSDRLTKGVGFLMRKHKIDVHMGEAKITAKDTISVKDSEGRTTELKTKNIVIATGANAAVPSGWKVDGEKILTYLEAILQEKLPKSVIVIGSGAIGVEFSTIWKSYGVDVTIVEMLPRLLPLEDEEVSTELSKKKASRCWLGTGWNPWRPRAKGCKSKSPRRREKRLSKRTKHWSRSGWYRTAKGWAWKSWAYSCQSTASSRSTNAWRRTSLGYGRSVM